MKNLILFIIILVANVIESLNSRIVSKRTEVEVEWDFEDSSEEWLATYEENDIELYTQSGELRGTIIGPRPNIDSPALAIDSSTGHFVVSRMSYHGQAKTLRTYLRYGFSAANPNTDDFSQSSWDARLDLVVVSCSSPLVNCSLGLDGDDVTYWETGGDKQAFVVMDFGNDRSVTSVGILPSESNGNGIVAVIQNGESPDGPFVTQEVQVILNLKEKQTIYLKDGIVSRYWRVLFQPPSFSSDPISIRTIDVKGTDDGVTFIDNPVISDGKFHTYYARVADVLLGRITQLRFQLLYDDDRKRFGESISFDYIRIVRAPIIYGVTGCVDYYSENVNFDPIFTNVTSIVRYFNQGSLSSIQTVFYSPIGDQYLYRKTMNCAREGGQAIVVTGRDFGAAGAIVTVDGKRCNNVVHTPGNEQSEVSCVLPTGEFKNGPSLVQIHNGILNGLTSAKYYLSYASVPATPNRPSAANVAAKSVDIHWDAPTDYLDAIIITGYKVVWRETTDPSSTEYFSIVGNVTKTSVKNLKPVSQYAFKISALNENQTDAEWLVIDLYGRRNMLQNALISEYSPETDVVTTLAADILLSKFTANSTLNHSASDSRVIVGPTGVIGGEGSYGLIIIGDSNVENCNASFLCCDEYSSNLGPEKSCVQYACSGIGRVNQAPIINGTGTRVISSNLENGEKKVLEWVKFKPQLPNIACGPSLRLTASFARQSGSFWYARRMNVREGFDTTFTFRISSPSQKCDVMEDVYTMCRSRGADGFAFVIQNDNIEALGTGGKGIGYEGIRNSIAVEFDTYYNYENLDSYENHISVQTRGWRYPNHSNHSYSLASSVRPPNLAEGVHSARIRYTPIFDKDDAMMPSFSLSSWTTEFLQNADFPNGGMPDWGTGFGLLYVFVDNLVDPLLITPMNLDATIKLHNGRAWAGFSSATGDDHFQVHDILSWEFMQLYIDPPFYQPPIVNNEGAFACASAEECVHQ